MDCGGIRSAGAARQGPNRTQRLVGAIGRSEWLLLATVFVVAGATLVPIDWRPRSSLPADFERAVVFAGFGILCTLAYPRQPWLALLGIIAMASGLELAQMLVPSRHGDVLEVGS